MPPIMIGTSSFLPNFRRKSSTRFIVSLAPNELIFYLKASANLRKTNCGAYRRLSLRFSVTSDWL
jgi:hypothetical protein